MEILNTALLGLVVLGVMYLILKNRTPRLKGASAKVIMCDTSALIDGRIVEVAKAGFLTGTIVIPSSVLREMQYLADNADHEKRARARHGLDVVHELQSMKDIVVSILDDAIVDAGGVDQRLVELSKKHNAGLLTLDFNLNKVAQAEGITTLNINQLAQSLRMSYLPGEKRSLYLAQKGQESTQAVGYLEDGTMVVVEQGRSNLGTSVEIEFTRALQTQAGKMLFAKKVQQASSSRPQSNTSRSDTRQKRSPRSSSRKKSPEDSLIELANKS